MPGFTIGGVGDGPSNLTETRRKHRWTFETIGTAGGTLASNVLLILREASRPQFSFEEPEMHHNQEKAYFAGKHGWEPISLVWYDGEQNPDVSKAMWDWLNGVVGVHTGNIPVSAPNKYKKNAKLQMLNGTGATSESWELFGVWPKDVNWKELDYTDTEIMTIEVSMRYDRANRAA